MIFGRFKLKDTVLGVLFCGFTISSAIADDTEIFLGSNAAQTSVRPNVTFLIDTSNSMSTRVTVEESYDPSEVYLGDCDSNRFYWSKNGRPPGCSAGFWIESSALQCESALDAISVTGLYLDTYARYRARPSARGGSYWTELSKKDNDDVVECQSDFGSHGDDPLSDNVYPSHGIDGGPWVSVEADGINWTLTGDTYTLYSANYLNWRASERVTTTATRMQLLQQTFNAMLHSSSNINIGLMRFDDKSMESNKGGFVALPLERLTNQSRSAFTTQVNDLSTGGWTPLAETLYEANLYYRGEPILFGDSTSPGVSHADSRDPSDTTRYSSPIEYQCQKNFTILMTDGEPSYDYDADDKIKALNGFDNISGTCDFNAGDDCLDELAEYMYTVDSRPDLDGKQNITTYTIGFFTDQELLSDTALRGGGRYFTVDSVEGLTDSFTQILTEILSINTTFVAPAVSVNAFNRLTHRDEVFFAVFRPGQYAKWAGNVKQYKISGSPPELVDALGLPAVDVNTGFFSSASRSFWTTNADAPDGEDVVKGGFSEQLSVDRNIYTDTGSISPDNVALTSGANLFHESNIALTKDLLGIALEDDAYRDNLLAWARGVDIFDEDEDGLTTDSRQDMGDPLHSKPVLVVYGGTESSPDITLYVSTNEGFLHAINASTGEELFSFVPQALLPNLKNFYDGASVSDHPYGLDGDITVWANDTNKNSIIETGEHVYLYVGMRRGGRNYYALDVTDRSSPKLMWSLKGGAGDFTELGQSWSRPQLATIKYNGADRRVLIIGGGYDTNQDSAPTASSDDKGRAIFIVDAQTGERLWWAGGSASGANLELAEMTNSIPARVSVVDIDADGYADQFYVGDMRAQLWRFDVNMENTGASNLIQGGRIASLGGSGKANNRRFYYAPDISLVNRENTYQLALSIGSGYRSHPLDKDAEDRFYTIFDSDVFSAPATYETLIETDLYDSTENIIGEGFGDAKSSALTSLIAADGWYIRMRSPEGEKVLAESRTVDGTLIFTTFTPVSNLQNNCAPSQGVARSYLVDVLDSTPKYNLDNVGAPAALTVADREKPLVRGGIPPEPTVLFPPGSGSPIVLIGAEKIDEIEVDLSPKRTSWQIE